MIIRKKEITPRKLRNQNNFHVQKFQKFDLKTLESTKNEA